MFWSIKTSKDMKKRSLSADDDMEFTNLISQRFSFLLQTNPAIQFPLTRQVNIQSVFVAAFYNEWFRLGHVIGVYYWSVNSTIFHCLPIYSRSEDMKCSNKN